jgi:hypothetical protein
MRPHEREFGFEVWLMALQLFRDSGCALGYAEWQDIADVVAMGGLRRAP